MRASIVGFVTHSEARALAPFLAVQYSPGTPRAIRVRLDHPRKSKRAFGDAPMVSHGDNVVTSPTGRRAMGPWDGAFESDGPMSPTVFSDSEGVIFSDLEGHPASFEEAAGESAMIAEPSMGLEVYRASTMLAIHERVRQARRGGSGGDWCRAPCATFRFTPCNRTHLAHDLQHGRRVDIRTDRIRSKKALPRGAGRLMRARHTLQQPMRNQH